MGMQYDDNHTFKCVDFLQLVRQLREEEAILRKASLQSLFSGMAWAHAPPVSRDDIPLLIADLGVCLDSCARVEEIHAIVEECNKEVADSLDTEEIVALVG